MQSTNYITVTEFKTFNPETDFSNYTDPTISGMISRASAWVDNYLLYTLPIEDISNELNEGIVDSDGNLVIYTQKVPIQSVSQIKIKLGTVQSTLLLTDGNGNDRYNIPYRKSYILFPFQELATTGTITISNFYNLRPIKVFTQTSYRAGYETIPSDIKDAVNLVAKDIFIRQANPLNVASISQGGISMSFRDRTDGKSDMILDAEGILKKYRKLIV